MKRLALVTGGAGDIGRAIARRLKSDHDLVLVADRDVAAAQAAASALGAGFLAVHLDVTDPESCAAAAAEAAKHGQVATLVNNAGAAQALSLQSTSVANWQADRSLNLDAAFYVFQAVADQLKATQGSVINIVSVNGMAVYGHPAYAAAKAGMIHLTRLIAVEYGRFGIRANSVAPGTVRTQAWEVRAAQNPNVFKEAAAHYPLGRIVRPEDVAEAVGFLASPLAAAITGTCLPVDCGLTAGTPALAHTFTQSADYLGCHDPVSGKPLDRQSAAAWNMGTAADQSVGCANRRLHAVPDLDYPRQSGARSAGRTPGEARREFSRICAAGRCDVRAG